jgi:hypothetical protein
MPRIHCHYIDCVFLDDVYCSAAAVELDPDTGCATYKPNEEDGAKDEDLEEEELEELDEEDAEDDEDDAWEEDKDDL